MRLRSSALAASRLLRVPEFDPFLLREALSDLDGSWSLPSVYAETGVHHGYRRIVLVNATHRLPAAEPFGVVLDAFAPVFEAWLSWIGPGGFIRPHRDAGPWRERWQVPIQAAGEFRATEAFVPVDGRAFPVEHWKPHAVINTTDQPRIHVVIDRDMWIDHTRAAFALFPIPDDMTDLVERSLDGTP